MDRGCFGTDSAVEDEQRKETASAFTNESIARVLSAVEENIALMEQILELKDTGVDTGRHFTATADTSHSAYEQQK